MTPLGGEGRRGEGNISNTHFPVSSGPGLHRQEVSPLRLARGARTAGNLLPPTAGPSVFLSSTTAVHRPTPPPHVPPWGGRTAVVEVDARLPRKGNSNSRGVSPVRETTSVITWSRTSRLPIKNSLSLSLEKLHPRIPDATSSGAGRALCGSSETRGASGIPERERVLY